MLLSMTGFGEAQRTEDDLRIGVEIRTINSRYFKLTLRCPDGYNSLEPKIEQVAREYVKRGAVQISIRLEQESGAGKFRIDDAVLLAYKSQLDDLQSRWHDTESIGLVDLLALPGVVSEQTPRTDDAQRHWPVMEQTVREAADQLARMREQEGSAMLADLKANCQQIAEQLDRIQERGPHVVENYRKRLAERLNKWLAEHDLAVEAADVVREVGLFAERSDISEEIVRMRSHLDQFAVTMDAPESAGRKLEFLTQEMFRETNTIGSKSNDAEISECVIEIKAAIERMREMIQNVE